MNEDGRGGEEGEEGDKKTEKSNAVLDSSALLRRRKVFNKNLGEITREHHRVNCAYMYMLHDMRFLLNALHDLGIPRKHNIL